MSWDLKSDRLPRAFRELNLSCSGRNRIRELGRIAGTGLVDAREHVLRYVRMLVLTTSSESSAVPCEVLLYRKTLNRLCCA